MEQEKLIRFHPITPGLGFHPFSDGLPYAPVTKNPSRPPLSTQGSGAVAAGPPTYALPRISVPVAPAPQPRPAFRPAPPAAPAVTEAGREPVRYGYGYLMKRVAAYSIDTFLNVALLSIGLALALINQSVSPDLLINPGILFVSILFFALFNWALVTAQEIAFGTSVGKRIFGLALQGSASAIFTRALFFLPSVGFAGIGLLWGVIDGRKRCWHDRVVEIQPSEIARF